MSLQEKKTYNENAKLVAGALKKFGITKSNNNYDDLFSEGLLIVVKSNKNHDESKSKFSTYVFSQIRFMVLNYYTKEKKSLAITDNYDFNTIISHTPDKSENNSDILIKAMSKLKEKEQDLIKKRIYEELSFSEIAKFYNKSKQAVQQMFQRVMGKLRKILALSNEVFV